MTDLDIPTVTTDRLVLRGIEPGDVEAFAAMGADPEYSRYIGGPRTLADTWRAMAMQIGTWALRGLGLWAVVERSTGDVVGRAGLWWEPGWPGIEAAWFFAPSRRGRGYAPEAARAALRFAFEVHDADRVISVIHPDN
ncbi:MAG: GNAT family N-acetyltransferase, partial [Frankia sp.]